MNEKRATEVAERLCDDFDKAVFDAGGGDLSDPLKTRMREHVEAALLKPVDNLVEHEKEEARIAAAEDLRDEKLVEKGKKPLGRSRIE